MAVLAHARPKRFTREDYYKLADSGVLAQGERVELIDGMIVAMSPQNLPHITAITLSTAVLCRVFQATHLVGCQTPISVGDFSEPEPDFSLITLSYLHECLRTGNKPSRPDLVVEISDSSYSYDTTDKASLYASAGIVEYWVLDLRTRRLEVRQDPGPDANAVFGHSYRKLQIMTDDQRVAPWFAPDISLVISELLPPIL